MKKILILVAAGLMTLSALDCRAQRFSVSTNLLGYAALGTMNVEGSYSMSRRFSLTVGAKYNPFIFGRSIPGEQMQLLQQSYSLGVRAWPWHTWSGWWFACKGRYQEYNFGGLISQETSEGDRYGLGLYAGYTHMVSSHFNVEFGLGGWGGLDFFRKYSCPMCGTVLDEGRKLFALPDDILISVVYVF